MSWWSRKGVGLSGVACFPGSPPLGDAFVHLTGMGVTVRPGPESGGQRRLRLDHPSWGRADLSYPLDASGQAILAAVNLATKWDPRLTPEEKAEAQRAGWAARADLESLAGDILRDRKRLLRYLRAALGRTGVAALDLTAQAIWPPAALDDELSHDAGLDIEALFSLHMVHEPPASEPYWLHSHGLREIGFTDFHILDPNPEIVARGSDLFRAIALAIVEGRLVPDAGPAEVARGVRVRLVQVRQFLARADPRGFARWRADVDESHTEGHGVLCDPGAGILRFRRDQPRPAGLFTGPLTHEPLIMFSPEASDLMARRARDTYPLLRTVAAELAEFDLPVLVKLAYAVDASPSNREHLWFQVHTFGDDHMEATLLNEPVGIGSMKEGDRGRHMLDRLSDWAIMTPLGPINPRWTVALRQIRRDPAGFREAVGRARAEGFGGSGP